MMRSNTISDQFQYTHSLRSATSGGRFPRGLGVVSIHALLTECDTAEVDHVDALRQFQSTHSLRSATLEARS